jgi:hypothetical protein
MRNLVHQQTRDQFITHSPCEFGPQMDEGDGFERTQKLLTAEIGYVRGKLALCFYSMESVRKHHTSQSRQNISQKVPQTYESSFFRTEFRGGYSSVMGALHPAFSCGLLYDLYCLLFRRLRQ